MMTIYGLGRPALPRRQVLLKFLPNAQGYKTLFMLNSSENEICSKYHQFKLFFQHSRAEHEIFTANKY